jgi:invasion protein IalB
MKIAHIALVFAAATIASLAGYDSCSAQTDAKAQNPGNASALSGWRVECASEGKTFECRALQQLVQRDSNQLVAGITIRVPPETKKPVMMVQLPLGILVAEPMTMKVDEGQPERLAIQTCTPSGCYVGSALSDGLLAAMRSGKQLKIAFQNNNKQTVSVDMPLAGFVPAYEKIK